MRGALSFSGSYIARTSKLARRGSATVACRKKALVRSAQSERRWLQELVREWKSETTSDAKNTLFDLAESIRAHSGISLPGIPVARETMLRTLAAIRFSEPTYSRANKLFVQQWPQFPIKYLRNCCTSRSCIFDINGARGFGFNHKILVGYTRQSRSSRM